MIKQIAVVIAASAFSTAVMYLIGVPSPWLILPAVVLSVAIVVWWPRS